MNAAIDCHLMVDNPPHHFEEIAASGGDSVTFHVEAVDDVGTVLAQARDHGLGAGVAFNPGTAVEAGAEAANLGADLCLCMSINPGYSGQEFLEESYERIERLRGLVDCLVQVDSEVNEENIGRVRKAGADLLIVGTGSSRRSIPAGLRRAGKDVDEHLQRALELASRRGTGLPEPPSARSSSPMETSSAKAARGAGGHAEVVALDAAGERARGATLYVTMEPCAHHGRRRRASTRSSPRVCKVVAGSRDPDPRHVAGWSGSRAGPRGRARRRL